jgi:hypothetical protein
MVALWFTCRGGPSQGREHEWMFASEEGRGQVAASCRSRRTILVSMRRSQQYGDVEVLKVCALSQGCCLQLARWSSSSAGVHSCHLPEHFTNQQLPSSSAPQRSRKHSIMR